MAETLHTPEALRALTIRIFTHAGWSQTEAADLAEHLVLANLTGHDSHGVGMIPAYIEAWQEGLLKPENQPETIRNAPPFLVIDGHVALGQPAAKAAMHRAVEVARDTGVCLLNLTNCNHIGRIGHYAEIAVEAGMIALLWVNVAGRRAAVAPFGAGEARFGTNPHAIGIPSGDGPLILDFATSRMAHGKTRVAFNKGEPLPPGYVIDAQGRPSTDPAVVQGEGWGGALLPFGDHKGAGVALAAEILSAVLTGAGRPITETARKSWIINNLFAVVFDPARLDPDGANRSGRIAALTNYLRATAPAEGVDRVRAPGDKERETLANRSRDGIPVDDETWRQLMAAEKAVGAA